MSDDRVGRDRAAARRRVAVGIDLTSVAEVEESIRVHAGRYLRRVYTSDELRECATAGGAPDARRLAACFAAKEAALKVLRSGDEAVAWREIGVRHRDGGTAELELSGAAAALAHRRGAASIEVSLARQGEFAAAVVVAELVGAP
jgi:holo-[acyl-carrier protein] synthase